jgi:hypothetical protein
MFDLSVKSVPVIWSRYHKLALAIVVLLFGILAYHLIPVPDKSVLIMSQSKSLSSNLLVEGFKGKKVNLLQGMLDDSCEIAAETGMALIDGKKYPIYSRDYA